MSYSPERDSVIASEEEKRLSKELTICRNVCLTVDSDGWQNTVGPLIDRLIVEVIGGKLGDTWVSGKVDRARSEERREFWIGYKQALIELHGRIMLHKTQLPILEERVKKVQQDKQPRYRSPMEDTRYAA